MNSPLLSVVIITPFQFAHLRKCVRHLRAQTIASSIELVIVAPTKQSVSDARPEELDGFAAVRIVEAGAIESIDLAAAEGFDASTAPLIAYADDHAYVEPDWAEALLKEFEGPWVLVVSYLPNANPTQVWSRVNGILSYGWWTEGNSRGECRLVPGHNITYRRDFLYANGPLHRNTFRRQFDLAASLRARGGRFILSDKARSHHTNASTWEGTKVVRLSAGRYYAHNRSTAENWSWAKRLLYCVCFPLIPPLRLVRLQSELAHVIALAGPRIYPALFAALFLDAMGQALGYVFGPGNSLHVLETYEVRLRKYVTPAEAAAMDE
jgi:hypothetical protein